MHFMAHGVGGFVGGIVGFLVLAAHNTCGVAVLKGCQELNALGFEPVAPELAVTIGALVGLLIGHAVKELVEQS